MAEKAEKKQEEKGPSPAAPAAAAVEKRASALRSTPVLVTLVMLMEAAILFAGFKFFAGGPVAAQGAELATGESHGEGGGDGAGHESGGGGHGEAGGAAAKLDPKKAVELKVLEFKATNKRTGRTFLYDVTIYLVTKGEFKEKVEQIIASRDALIRDRIRTIIAQSDPEKLGGSEPGLETLRRQVKYQLDEIIGEGIVDEILVPRCIPYRADI